MKYREDYMIQIVFSSKCGPTASKTYYFEEGRWVCDLDETPGGGIPMQLMQSNAFEHPSTCVYDALMSVTEVFEYLVDKNDMPRVHGIASTVPVPGERPN